MLLKNRAKVLYCTRLGQAQGAEDRAVIEAEMAADETGEGPAILEALATTRTAESWVSSSSGAAAVAHSTCRAKSRSRPRALRSIVWPCRSTFCLNAL